jgi:signal transduction histidine kinase
VFSRIAIWLTIALLVGTWAVDMLTPEAVIAAVLLTIPVAIASVFLDRRFTGWIVALALLADVVAGWSNGMRAGGHWDSIAIANRALAAFSIVLVGWLGNIAQTAAERSGRLAAGQRQAQRAEAIRRAFERIRSSLNVDLVARAIVRESIVTLGADAAVLYMLDASTWPDLAYRFDRAAPDVTVDRLAPPAALAQFVRRAIDGREVILLMPTDPVARLCLDELGAADALVFPLADASVPLAALVLIAREPGTRDVEPAIFFQTFAEQAGTAIAHASLFVELARKNEELAQANVSIEERSLVIRDIVYALSHDLRTPLAAAAMTLQQALEGKYGSLPERYQDILRRSIESNSELRRLAETLLTVAKYESGEHSAERGPVRLGALARSVVDELDPLWHSKGIRLRVGDDETAVAAGDGAELRRAVMNLLSNAVSWTPEGGTIAVSVSRNGDSVSLSVEDDGYGVPQAERESLFARLPAKPARAGSGSGLGLYIVRRIAESHGGTVAFKPREPHGSEFVLTLPAHAAVSQHV